MRNGTALRLWCPLGAFVCSSSSSSSMHTYKRTCARRPEPVFLAKKVFGNFWTPHPSPLLHIFTHTQREG
uniref:Putative secreted peptide n=1 Tax=Anopheles braziliensis TaxID=58242 RepID=A0A2M3ZVC1_9DIPT